MRRVSYQNVDGYPQSEADVSKHLSKSDGSGYGDGQQVMAGKST